MVACVFSMISWLIGWLLGCSGCFSVVAWVFSVVSLWLLKGFLCGC